MRRLGYATLALQHLIGRRTVTCDERDVDRYGRVASRCSVGEADINEWLVLQGLALAYRKYSRDYMAAEKPAPPATGCGSARSRRGNGGTGADREIAGRVIGDDETGRRVIAIAIDEWILDWFTSRDSQQRRPPKGKVCQTA